MATSTSLYPDIVLRQDLTPTFGHDIDAACEEIYKACKGFGTDEKALVKTLGTKNQEKRTLISIRYEQLKGKELKDVLKKEVGGDLGDALQLLGLPPDKAEVKLIKKATKGAGTKEKHLYPILCGRSNADMDVLKKAYFKTEGKDLGSLVSKETGGDFEKLLLACVQGGEEVYDPNHHTAAKAKEDAETIYEAGQGRMGTNEKKIFSILVFSPPKHLKEVNSAYADKYGYTLFKALEKELGGDVEKGALFTLGMKLKPYETVARLIQDACAGMGTDELLLTACIIRYQKILSQVMVAHIELFGKSLQDRVKKEVRGKYEDLLLEVLNSALPDGSGM